jgi:predicted transcriptional regulator
MSVTLRCKYVNGFRATSVKLPPDLDDALDNYAYERRMTKAYATVALLGAALKIKVYDAADEKEENNGTDN